MYIHVISSFSAGTRGGVNSVLEVYEVMDLLPGYTTLTVRYRVEVLFLPVAHTNLTDFKNQYLVLRKNMT